MRRIARAPVPGRVPLGPLPRRLGLHPRRPFPGHGRPHRTHPGTARCHRGSHHNRRHRQPAPTSAQPTRHLAARPIRPRPHRLPFQEPVHVRHHLAHRGIPARRPLLEAAQANGLQVLRDPRAQRPRARRLLRQHRPQRPRRRLAPERRPVRQQEVQQPAQGEHVRHRPGLAILVRGLLRCRILGRSVPHRPVDRSRSRTRPSRQPEVRQAHVALRVHQNVARLQVMVKQPMLMRVRHRLRNAPEQPRRLHRRHHPRGQPAAQVRALHPFHREVHAPVRRPKLMDPDDPRMIQARRRRRLVLQRARRIVARIHGLRMNQLQRAPAPQLPMPRPVNDPEPAAGHLRLQVVGAQGTGRHRVQPCLPPVMVSRLAQRSSSYRRRSGRAAKSP